MGLTAADVAKSLGDSHRLGDGGWKCRCPAHQDDKGSLSVSDSKGKLLVRCHAGCSQDQVISALQELDLWPKPRSSSSKRKASWTPVLPVPPEAGDPGEVYEHYKLGKSTKRWVYRDEDGNKVGFIYRFEETKDGVVSKTTLPMSWCKSDAGELAWSLKSFSKPRPLYNLHLLSRRPKAPVAVFEGEKAADRASELFTEYVCVTWPGGGKAVRYVDLKPLVGRDVTLWPDADGPGRAAMAQAGEILFAEGATKIRMVDVPEELDKIEQGWDVADAVPSKLDMDLAYMLSSAKTFSPGGEDVVAQLNRRYAFVLLGGKGAVLRETPNEDEGRIDVDYLSVEGFNQFYSNSKVPVGRGFMTAGKFWMTHEDRRTYEGVTFAPGRKVPGQYNLWRGFTVAPDPKGDWSIFKEHLRRNAANGDEEHFKWIFGWFAQIFQQPSVKTATSLSFRGKQGTGKTVIGKMMGHLIRSHYSLVEDSRYLFSNFNAHFASTILLHSDESFWGGDPRNIGKLKALVSSDTHRIEYKQRDTIEIPNYMRLLITTNNDFVVPAAAEERRFAVFDMGDDRMQDVDYFIEMQRQLRDGGFSGLLHDLLTFDLSTTSIHRIPNTAALRDQKQTSMSDVGKFWVHCLTEGEILPGYSVGWPREVASQKLYEVAIECLERWGSRYRPDPSTFVREMRSLVPEGSLADDRRNIAGKSTWVYVIPNLDGARRFLDEKFGTEFPWKVEAAAEEARLETTDEIPF